MSGGACAAYPVHCCAGGAHCGGGAAAFGACHCCCAEAGAAGGARYSSISSKTLEGNTLFQVPKRRTMLFFCVASTFAYAVRKRSLNPSEKHLTKGPLRFFTTLSNK